MSRSLVPPPSYEELAAEHAQLRAENAQLKTVLAQVLARIGELEARLAMTSKNSGKPPSSDGLAKPTPKSLRGKSSRGPGRPKGQPGTTLRQVEVPDHEVAHEPSACCGCGADLHDAPAVGMERRQVFDLPPLRLEVTEHQLISRACSCGTVTKAEAPQGVGAPVQYGPRLAGIGVYLFHGQFLSKSRTVQALSDLFGVAVAAATVVGWTTRIAAQVTGKVIAVIRDRIAGSAVAHFDETGFRTSGRLHWMHSASTSTDVLLTIHPRRGVKGMDAAGVLPRFGGVAVHDAWAPYDTYTKVTHALCNAHAVRELVYVVDTAPAKVADLADQAIDAMVKIKELVDTARDHGREPDTEAVHAQQHLLRSAAVLGKGATAARATKLERKHHALFTRLTTRWQDYQRFTTDPAIPWDNNPAEQTIRMPKLRIKVSGCLRSLSGADEFAAIRSYTATAARQGHNMLDVLIEAADDHPWIPAT
ncbi:MAG: IS66 family transposase [Carbonactinosporaceae bacterium]